MLHPTLKGHPPAKPATLQSQSGLGPAPGARDTYHHPDPFIVPNKPYSELLISNLPALSADRMNPKSFES
ncbi:MAG TPA: hypothetical protein ACFCUD_14420 [Cyclobacteriaceae bacterium]